MSDTDKIHGNNKKEIISSSIDTSDMKTNSDGDGDSNTTNESKPMEVEVESFDFNEYIKSIKYPVVASVVTGGAAGGIRGFYLGDMGMLFGYSMGFTAGLFGVSFFSTDYFLKKYRKKDDIWNPTIAGGTSGMLLTISKGPKRAIPLGLVASIAGYAYYSIGNTLYDFSRSLWLQHRTELLNIAPKIFSQTRKIPPPREGVPEKYRFNEWNWKNDKDIDIDNKKK